jgi:ribosome-associated protein
MQDITSVSLSGVDSELLARELTKIIIEKKALDIKLFAATGENPITSFYLNVTGRSATHVSSLADELVYQAELRGRNASHVEGGRGASWILVDFGDVIVNVFDKESRTFYSLDRLMPAETEIDIANLYDEVDAKLNINKD